MEAQQPQVYQPPELMMTEDEKPIVDIETMITTGNDIQLEAFKCLPEFSGVPGTYRNWRNQVLRAMRPIEKFSDHPKYGAALGIIRAKIVGPASNTLMNTGTRNTIQHSYTIEAELTSLFQAAKTLREFYDAINQALNVLITKIIQTYPMEQAR